MARRQEGHAQSSDGMRVWQEGSNKRTQSEVHKRPTQPKSIARAGMEGARDSDREATMGRQKGSCEATNAKITGMEGRCFWSRPGSAPSTPCQSGSRWSAPCSILRPGRPQAVRRNGPDTRHYGATVARHHPLPGPHSCWLSCKALSRWVAVWAAKRAATAPPVSIKVSSCALGAVPSS